MALPVPVPMYLNVYWGKAFSKPGWITFGIRPESLTSLVPMTVSEDEVSALASAGEIRNIAAATRPRNGTASNRRVAPDRPLRSCRRAWRPKLRVLNIR